MNRLGRAATFEIMRFFSKFLDHVSLFFTETILSGSATNRGLMKLCINGGIFLEAFPRLPESSMNSQNLFTLKKVTYTL